MIVPNDHIGDYSLVDQETALEMHRLLQIALKALKKEYKPHGFNVGYNFGRPAGAGLEEHIHMHVVPRWNGDTNFMPVIARTKVISEDLFSTYDRIKRAIEEIIKS